jgi:hypothetical protein
LHKGTINMLGAENEAAEPVSQIRVLLQALNWEARSSQGVYGGNCWRTGTGTASATGGLGTALGNSLTSSSNTGRALPATFQFVVLSTA